VKQLLRHYSVRIMSQYRSDSLCAHFGSAIALRCPPFQLTMYDGFSLARLNLNAAYSFTTENTVRRVGIWRNLAISRT
jgi:hypothetical protein